MYQLASLLSSDIAEMAETYGSKLVVVADLLGMFNEPEMARDEATRLLDAIHSGMVEAKKKLVVIATLSTSNKFERLVSSWSDVAVNFSPQRGRRVRAELQRHPTKRPDACEFSLNQLFRSVRPVEVFH